jgi:hypothetical protein
MASTRSTRIIRAAGIPVGVLLAGALVLQSSHAAFTASTTTPTSNWTTGTVALSDNDNNTALFTTTGMVPGSTGTKDIVVTYSGDVTAPVKFYATSTAGDLATSNLFTVTVSQGSTQIYTGTLAGMATTYTAGLGNWTPTATGQTQTYTIKYTLDANATNALMGKTGSAGFTWETRV